MPECVRLACAGIGTEEMETATMIGKNTPSLALLRLIHGGSAAILALALLCAATTTPQLCAESTLARKLPLYFVENRGQLAEEVSYVVQGADKTFYFTADGVTVDVCRTGDDGSEAVRWSFRLELRGARRGVEPVGVNRQPAVFNFFKGSRDDWVTDVATYQGLVYRELWPGIDMHFEAGTDELKYEFHLSPGADADLIRLAWRGASSVVVNDRGGMEINTPAGGLTDGAPVAYQDRNGERVTVSASFALAEEQPSDLVLWGFDLGAYDLSRPLVVDPSMLLYCGYIGGDASDSIYDCAVDAEGCLYVAGRCATDAGFPVLVGPDLSYNGGNFDAFIAKVSATGDRLIYCGFIGGTDYEHAYSVAVDRFGRAYVAGDTASDDGSFPTLVGPDLTFNGSEDTFVLRLSTDGTSLEYSGFIGGVANDKFPNIAIDALGNAYISGTTSSPESSFPVTVGPDLTYNGQYSDAYVAKVSATGHDLVFCGYIGGDKIDRASAIDVDVQGGVFVAGGTYSSQPSFPVLVGPDLTSNGDYDAFVCRVVPSGSALSYCGFVGGSAYDTCTGVALDSNGCLCMAGFTESPQGTFPVAVGPDLTHNGGDDGFVAKVSAAGDALEFCGYIGGSSEDWCFEIEVGPDDNLHVVGVTQSMSDFPVRVGPDLTHNGDHDAFAARVIATGEELDYCGFVGGSEYDFFEGMALDVEGCLFGVGSTGSTENTLPVLVGPDTTFNSTGGQFDGLVCKMPPYHVLLRSGFVRKISGDPVDVLSFNGSAGTDAQRKITLENNQLVQIRMAAPPTGPNPARYALYMHRGEAGSEDVSHHPDNMGTACFTTPLTWTPPGTQIFTLVNNIGAYSVYGTPRFPRVPPAPSVVFTGRLVPGTYTFQGLIEDTASGVLHLTNAVVVVQKAKSP